MKTKPKVIKRRFITGQPTRQNVGAIAQKGQLLKPKGKRAP